MTENEKVRESLKKLAAFQIKNSKPIAITEMMYFINYHEQFDTYYTSEVLLGICEELFSNFKYDEKTGITF